jgi:hypothetical protein
MFQVQKSKTWGMRRKRKEDEELRGKKLFERGRL